RGGPHARRHGRGGGRAHPHHDLAHPARGPSRARGRGPRGGHLPRGGAAAAADIRRHRRDDRARPLAQPAAGLARPHAARGGLMELLRIAWTFLWLSFLCIGGGLGIVPEIERQAVTAHQWITSREFVDAYTIAQLTPGPNMKIAAFIGSAARGPLGALVAAVAMFVPPAILTALVSQHWGRFRGRPWALASEHTLDAIGMGLVGGGCYTRARAAPRDARWPLSAGGGWPGAATRCRAPPFTTCARARSRWARRSR